MTKPIKYSLGSVAPSVPKPDTPASRVASRLVTRLGLVPPIDIASVAGQYAQVERVSALPAGADAVTTSLKVAGVKPTILHSGSVSSNRTRFTLAHELGHIVLPWHIGVIVSHAQFGVVYPSGAYGEMEKEANQFAAEFLAPSL